MNEKIPKAKIDRLISSMKGFMKAQEEEKCRWLNGDLPPKQKRIMKSILKQANAINYK